MGFSNPIVSQDEYQGWKKVVVARGDGCKQRTDPYLFTPDKTKLRYRFSFVIPLKIAFMCHALNVWFSILFHSNFRCYSFHIPNTIMLMFPRYQIYLSDHMHVPIVTSFQEYFIHIPNIHVNKTILFTLSILSTSHSWGFQSSPMQGLKKGRVVHR